MDFHDRIRKAQADHEEMLREQTLFCVCVFSAGVGLVVWLLEML